MRCLELFAGIGGFALAWQRLGWQPVAFVEINPFCQAVLRKHWPEVPIHDDVRTFSAIALRGVDLVSGGFPCQPHSVAGKRLGQADERHLWPEMLRIVREVRPRWVVAENVPGIRTTAADEVLGDLEAAGYACWPLVVGADDVGAPHRRKRVWFVAYSRQQRGRARGEPGPGTSASSGENRDDQRRCARITTVAYHNAAGLGAERGGGVLDRERPARGDDADGCGEWPVGEPTGAGLAQRWERAEPARAPLAEYPCSGGRWPARPGQPQHDWEEPRLAAFSVGGATDGLPERLVRVAERRVRRANREALKAYGNSIVPQVAEAIGRAIIATEQGLDVAAGRA